MVHLHLGSRAGWQRCLRQESVVLVPVCWLPCQLRLGLHALGRQGPPASRLWLCRPSQDTRCPLDLCERLAKEFTAMHDACDAQATETTWASMLTALQPAQGNAMTCEICFCGTRQLCARLATHLLHLQARCRGTLQLCHPSSALPGPRKGLWRENGRGVSTSSFPRQYYEYMSCHAALLYSYLLWIAWAYTIHHAGQHTSMQPA